MIALGVGGFLALICLFAGCSTYFSASSPEAKIEETAKQVESGRTSNPPPPAPEGQTPRPAIKTTNWGTIANQEARFDIARALFDDGAAGDNRRFQPVIKAMDSDPKYFQLDYIRRGVYVYDAQDSKKMLGVFKVQEGALTQPQSLPQPPQGMQGQQGQQGQPIDPVFLVADKRLVVVSATFPYFEQAELFRKALRFERLEDMFAAGLRRRLRALIVERKTQRSARKTARKKSANGRAFTSLTMPPARRSQARPSPSCSKRAFSTSIKPRGMPRSYSVLPSHPCR